MGRPLARLGGGVRRAQRHHHGRRAGRAEGARGGAHRLLLTFGSPLDKIAFIFGAQLADAKSRDALAASFQPLILDYERFRTIPWVNIWSPADIISGDLDFYDDLSKSGGRQVDNVVDARATTPLLAHVEYWKNDLLFERLYEGIVREDVAAAAERAAR